MHGQGGAAERGRGNGHERHGRGSTRVGRVRYGVCHVAAGPQMERRRGLGKGRARDQGGKFVAARIGIKEHAAGLCAEQGERSGRFSARRRRARNNGRFERSQA